MNIDYGEVWLHRYDEWVRAGRDPREVMVHAAGELNRALGLVQQCLMITPSPSLYIPGMPPAPARPVESPSERRCGEQSTLADGPCCLPKGHEGWHADGIRSRWDSVWRKA